MRSFWTRNQALLVALNHDLIKHGPRVLDLAALLGPVNARTGSFEYFALLHLALFAKILILVVVQHLRIVLR